MIFSGLSVVGEDGDIVETPTLSYTFDEEFDETLSREALDVMALADGGRVNIPNRKLFTELPATTEWRRGNSL